MKKNTRAEKQEHILSYKVNNFSFLHWLGISFVVLGHQYILQGYSAPRILGIECSNLGLRILFVVSGYLTMESYKRTGNTLKYLLKRIIRIFPGLIICILGTALLLGPVFTTQPLEDYFMGCKRYIINNILLNPVFDLPGVFTDNIYPISVNGSLWSLPIEVICYFCIPIIVTIYSSIKKIGNRLSVLLAFLFIIFLYIMYMIKEVIGGRGFSYVFWGTDWLNAFSIIIYFFLGTAFSCVGRKINLNLQWSVLIIIIYMFMPGMLNIILRPVIITYFIFSLAFDYPPVLSTITNKLKCYYSVYLWAFPIQQALIYIIIVKKDRYIHPLILFSGSFALILLIAYLITKYIEEPISKLATHK